MKRKSNICAEGCPVEAALELIGGNGKESFSII